MMKQPEWDGRRSVRDNARRELSPLVASYLDYVRSQLAKDPPPPKLHPLRLATKRLRYTLELFRPIYGKRLDERLGALRQVQQQLGDTNDCVAAWDLLSQLVRPSAEHTRMEKFLQRRAEKQAADFRALWQELFESPGREKWFMDFLSRPSPNAHTLVRRQK
ncbi:MAG TPA: CHAD domain-containing protein [Bryobacteraceae bacterium]|nr:CHAD domain-containing protein [Bryobacteraceae bacterium]